MRRTGEAPGRPSPGALYENDVLATGPRATAKLVLRDGREFTLAENTSLRIGSGDGAALPDGSPKESAVVFNLQMGSVTTLTPPATRNDISVTFLTPFGMTRVPAGTGDGTISVAGEKVKIDVSMGSIAFTGKNGRPVVAASGERIEGDFGRIELVQPAGAPGAAATAKAPIAKPGLEIAPIEFVLAATSGSMSVRRPGEKRFTPLKNEGAVPEGTVYRVPPGSRGHLLARGLSAWLSGGAEGSIGKSSTEGTTERYELNLERGSSMITLTGGKPREVQVMGPHGPVSLSTNEQTSVTVTQGADGPIIDVLAGQAEIAAGGSSQRVTAGSVARLQGGRVVVDKRGRADITLPTMRGLRVFGDELHEVGLTWPGDVKTPSVEVAGDPGFAHPIMAGRVAGSQTIVVPPARGDLYWRVTDGTSHRTLLGQVRFAGEDKPMARAATPPHTLVAETGLRATVHFQSALPAITFSFAPQPAARQYRVRVFAAEDSKKLVVDKTVSEPSCPLPGGTLREGGYVWTVTGIDAAGAELPAGPASRLDLVFDNALTSLVIERPAAGERAANDGVDIRGATPLGATLFVNDKPVLLDAKGRFDTRMAAAPRLIFRLVDKDGAETYWVRGLLSASAKAGQARRQRKGKL